MTKSQFWAALGLLVRFNRSGIAFQIFDIDAGDGDSAAIFSDIEDANSLN